MNSFRLERFVDAQEKSYSSVIEELAQCKKRTHWMWFIFPQVKGLGRSEMANYYGIESLEEAAAYLKHPVLGKRLLECTELVLNMPNSSLLDCFGGIDEMKLKSSMTLFAYIAGSDSLFESVLKKHFDGQYDELSLQRIEKMNAH